MLLTGRPDPLGAGLADPAARPFQDQQPARGIAGRTQQVRRLQQPLQRVGRHEGDIASLPAPRHHRFAVAHEAIERHC